MSPRASTLHVFFFNDTATTEIYTLSLHDALPISIAAPTRQPFDTFHGRQHVVFDFINPNEKLFDGSKRSEEHTSELQSHSDLVCRLLLEKKKKQTTDMYGNHLDARMLYFDTDVLN